MIWIAYYLAAIFLTGAAGFPVWLIFGGDGVKNRAAGWAGENETVDFPLVFLSGGAFLILAGYWLSWAGLGFRTIVWVVAGMVAALYGYLFISRQLPCTFRAGREQILSLLVCVACGALALIPRVVFHGEFTYGDTYTYICIADYIQDHGYLQDAGMTDMTPWLSQITLYQRQHLRMGAQFFLAFWTAVFRQTFSLELFGPSSGAGVFLLGCAVLDFLKKRFAIPHSDAKYGVLFCIANAPIVIWSAIYGLLPQLFGMAYMTVSLACTLNIMQAGAGTSRRNAAGRYFLCALFISTLGVSYSEILPFYALAVAAWWAWQSAKRRKILWSGAGALFRLAVLSVAIICTYFPGMVQGILLQFGATPGVDPWMNWFSHLGYLLGSVGPDSNYYYMRDGFRGIVGFSYIVFTCGMLFVLFVGAKKMIRRGEKSTLEEWAVLSSPYFFLLIYFTSVVDNPFEAGTIGNPWSTFKLVQYYFVIFAPYASVAILSFFGKTKALKWFYTLFFLFGCVKICRFSDGMLISMRQYTGESGDMIGEYYALGEEYQDVQEPITLLNLPIEHRRMVSYVLRDHLLRSDWGSDGYVALCEENASENTESGITLYYDAFAEDKVANLVELGKEFVILTAGEGVGVNELNDTDTWTWNDPEAVYQMVTGEETGTALVSFEASCAAGSGTLSVFYGDLELCHVEVNAAERTPVSIEFAYDGEESDLLRFVYEGESVREAGLESGRLLSVVIWNLRTK